MNRVERKNIKNQIVATKFQNIEQNFFFLKYYLEALIKTSSVFKDNFQIKLDLKNAFDDYIAMMREEKLLMKLLMKHSDSIDYYEADYFLAIIDEVNEKVILDLYNYFDDIDVGCEMKTEYRAIRKGRKVETIIDTDKYRKMFTSLLLKNKDINEYLGYPIEFWNYYKNIICYDSEDEELYGIIYDIDDGSIINITLPKIINLESAIMYIEILEEAYAKFKDTEVVDRTIEFEDKYLKQKTINFFKKYN